MRKSDGKKSSNFISEKKEERKSLTEKAKGTFSRSRGHPSVRFDKPN